RSVVQGVAEMLDRVPHEVADGQDRGVPTGDDQHDAVRGQRAVLEDVGGGVARQVVDAVQGHAEGPGHGFGGGQADMHRGGQAGAGGGGHVGDVTHLDTGIVEGDAQGGDGGFEV